MSGLAGQAPAAPAERRFRGKTAALGNLLPGVRKVDAAGTIGGTEPNPADLQILTSIRTLESFADLAPLVRGRPAALAAALIVPSMPGPVPPALPKSWLDRAQAST